MQKEKGIRVKDTTLATDMDPKGRSVFRAHRKEWIIYEYVLAPGFPLQCNSHVRNMLCYTSSMV